MEGSKRVKPLFFVELMINDDNETFGAGKGYFTYDFWIFTIDKETTANNK